MTKEDLDKVPYSAIQAKAMHLVMHAEDLNQLYVTLSVVRATIKPAVDEEAIRAADKGDAVTERIAEGGSILNNIKEEEK